MIRCTIFILILFSTAATGTEKRPNILFITIDTLRADRLGCYGYQKAETPVIDRVSAQGIVFRNATSHVPLTRPSHISIFTGLYPYRHGVHDNTAAPLKPDIPILAEILKQNGYHTSAFISSFVINSQSGLQRGFDTYMDQFDPQKQPTQFALNLEKRGEQVFHEFSTWLRRTKSRPYFAWVHLYDPHFPYEAPAPYSNRFAGRPYDGEVAYSDHIVGKLTELIDDETLLILTSDHGESLGDHGENAHSYFIYDATLHVPLIFRWPGVFKEGASVSHQVRLVDLTPTLLDLLNIPPPPRLNGVSLKKWLLQPDAPDPNLYSYCETYTPWLHFGWSRLQGVRAKGWKYIEAPTSELYDLKEDPGETQNVLDSRKARAHELKLWLTRSGALQDTGHETPQDLDPETLEKLAALGYAGLSSPPPLTGDLADPKAKLEDFKIFNKLIREGVEDFQAERYEQAAAKFQELRDRNIPSFEVHYYLGRSLLRLKSYDKCRTELELALQKLPHFLPAYRDLSEAWEGLGKPDEAEKALLAGLTISPDNPVLVHPLAWYYQRRKDYPAAEKVLLAALNSHPDDQEARYRLGAIYRDTDRPKAAAAQFQEVLRRNPDDAFSYNHLGMLYGGMNQLQESLSAFEKAAELAPGDKIIRQNLELAKSRLAKRNQDVATTADVFRFRIIQTSGRAAADSLLRKLRSGQDWDSLARDYSLHPSARTTNPVLATAPKDLDPALSSVLKQMKPGEISDVVETSAGFFILRKE